MILVAGIDRIEKKTALVDPTVENVYEMNPEELQKRDTGSLPGNLFEAVSLTEKALLCGKRSESMVFRNFVQNKKIGWDNYLTQVSAYEVERYLPLL
ncbi:MAG: hypothetical protein A2Z74_03135 [Chloroflexi bacterium RBG_13_46_9]|nr:MAG: hypothetical protein A2Z74_03135 [Chloroflexi bacterium RBG_13_46_9]